MNRPLDRLEENRIKKTALFLLFVALLLAAGAEAIHAQSALDGFDPKANGAIRVVVVQADSHR